MNDLGVIIDDLLSVKDHVQRICRSSFYQLRQLRAVRKSLSMESCEALIHAFVSSRLDYCNSLLYGINKFQLDMLQSVLRASARLIFRKRKFDSISLEICDKLHWLPVKKRIDFKICAMVYKCLHGGAPPYLVDDDVASHRCTSPATSAICNKGRPDHPQHKNSSIWAEKFQRFWAKPSGTHYRSTSDTANRLKHLENN